MTLDAVSEPVVLDASAVLALIKNEPGAETVVATLPGALLTTVNFVEVRARGQA